MAGVLKTRSDYPYSFDVSEAGYAGPNGQGGIVLERAARFMSEFQEKNEDGSVKYGEDGLPIPLSGSELTNAAKQYVKIHSELEFHNLKQEAIEALPDELDAPGSGFPPLEEHGRMMYEKDYVGMEPRNDNPEEVVNPDEHTGAPAPPPQTLDDASKGGSK